MDNEKFEFENDELNEAEIQEQSEESVYENDVEVNDVFSGEEETLLTDVEDNVELPEDFSAVSDEIFESECILSEEELLEIENRKKIKRKKTVFTATIALAVILIAGLVYSICTINGVGSKNIVNTPMPSSYTEDGKLIQEDLDVKFESPFISLFEGKNSKVLKVNGYGIDEEVFNYYLKNTAMGYQYNLYQTGVIEDLSEFSWDDVDKKTGLTYKEIVKGETVKSLSLMLAVCAEAEKRGVAFSETDEKGIADWLKQLKDAYGDKLEETVIQSGYDSISQLEKLQRMHVTITNCQKAFSDDPFSFVKQFDNYEEILTADKVSVKHVLIKFPEGITNESTEEEKAETKKKATEVLNKAKSGEDFSDLVFDYSEDPGQTEYGYTFANDGSMVQEFADASFALKVNEISNLVETPYGYHIIKKIDRVPDFIEYTKLLNDNMKIRINTFDYSKLVVDADVTPYIQPQVTPEPQAVDEEKVSE